MSTASLAEAYPPSLPVGEIITDTDPSGQSLTAQVRPFSEPQRLSAVFVLTWPTDQGPDESDIPIPTVPGGDVDGNEIPEGG